MNDNEKDINPGNAMKEENEMEPDINTDENAGGNVYLNDEVESASYVEKIEVELQEMKNKYVRLLAEFENYKKRNARERIELIQTANKEVIISLLEVLDDCDRAAAQLENATDINAAKDGISLVFNKLRATLQSKGLKEMESLHTDFDADLHDAVAEIPAPEKNLKGKVVDNIQKGYYLNDKLIRHAKVIVGK